jgi:hypothetical protein
MWRLLKKAKDLFSWFSFVWHIVGWLGLAAIVSGTAVTVVGVVGAVIKGLPWPFVLMAAYCTFVGMAYLAALPVFVKALGQQNIGTLGKIKPKIAPHYEAWKHVDQFTVREAAFLWTEREPNSGGSYTDVDAWVEAFCSSISNRKIDFIPSRITGELYDSLGSSQKQKEAAIKSERDNAKLWNFSFEKRSRKIRQATQLSS